MTRTRIALAVLLLVLAAPALFLATGCGGQKPPAAAKETWICPMHPEVVKDRKDSCPICGIEIASKKEREDDSQAAG